MLLSSKFGKTDLAKDKLAIVKCEGCQTERTVHFLSNYKKTTHLCRSCSTTKRLTGKKYSPEHCKAIGDGQRYKGWRMHDGYKELYVEKNHPRKKPYKGGNYVFEHILVMEQKLERFLEDHEFVHHIDENRLNNHPDNLFLCSGKNLKESRQIHNAIHQSAEELTIELYKKGLVKFENERYVLSSELASLAASVL